MMDPITLLQVTHIEQRVARQAAATHNLALRERRERTAGRARSILARISGTPATSTRACATC